MLYRDLEDRLFRTPGNWSLRQCPNPGCGLVWLDPMPLQEEIGKTYEKYYTQRLPASVKADNADICGRFKRTLKRFDDTLRFAYLERRYGYPGSAANWWWWLSLLFPRRRKYYALQVMYLPYCKSGKLLEIGSGSGRFIAEMRDLGWEVEGVELDHKAASLARVVYRIPVRAGTIYDQSYPDQSFNAIALSHVIEHVHDPVAFLSECYRVLTPGGSLVITTPNAKSLGASPPSPPLPSLSLSS